MPSKSLHRHPIRIKDNLLNLAIWLCAGITVSILVVIIGYILINGIPNISWTFLTDIYRESDVTHRGILPMIINTLYLIVITLLIAVPIGISSAIYLTQYARQGKLVKLIRFATETLAGIPSIVYGLFGFALFVSLFKFGYSMLAGAMTLAIMVLPTIVRTTEESLLAVPPQYREGALALGAKKLRVIVGIIVPNAMPGILTAIILSMGRIVGESAALIYTSGMVLNMPSDIFGHVMESGQTLSLHLYSLATRGDSLEQSFATAAVLLIIVFALNRLAKLFGSLASKK